MYSVRDVRVYAWVDGENPKQAFAASSFAPEPAYGTPRYLLCKDGGPGVEDDIQSVRGAVIVYMHKNDLHIG